jgi:hypothetical protein
MVDNQLTAVIIMNGLFFLALRAFGSLSICCLVDICYS